MNNPPLLDVKHLILIIDIFKIYAILYTRSQGKDLKTRKGFKMKIITRIILDEQEQDLISKVDALLDKFYLAVETQEQENTIQKLQNSLHDFAYTYGSDEYRADY